MHSHARNRGQVMAPSFQSMYSAVDFMKSCGARPVISIPRFCWGSKCSCFPTTLYFDVQPTEVENALLCWHPPSCDPSGGALL